MTQSSQSPMTLIICITYKALNTRFFLCIFFELSAVITDLDEMLVVPCVSCLLIYRGPSSANRRFRIIRVPNRKPPLPTFQTQQYQAKRIQRRGSGMQATCNLCATAVGISFMSDTSSDQQLLDNYYTPLEPTAANFRGGYSPGQWWISGIRGNEIRQITEKNNSCWSYMLSCHCFCPIYGLTTVPLIFLLYLDPILL